MILQYDQINAAQIQELLNLQQRCKKHDGNAIPIYRHLIEKRHPLPCNILYYKDNLLVGYLRSFFFYAESCEITLMVDPEYRKQKIATELLQKILPIMRAEHIKELVFSTPAKKNEQWFKSLNFTYRNSEYHMQYNLNYIPKIKPRPIKVRHATIDDIPAMNKIDGYAFPNKNIDADMLRFNLENMHNCDILVLVYNDDIIGKAHIFTETDKIRLTDIGVLPEYRGQGFGSALIKHCINHCLIRNKSQITLDVETHNTNAIKIYQNLGFEIINAHDYWNSPIDKANYGLWF